MTANAGLEKRIYNAAGGTITVWFINDEDMVFQWGGSHSVDSADFMWKTINSVTALGIKPNFFVDLEKVTETDNSFRLTIVKCVLKTRSKVKDYNFFMGSKPMAMVVSALNLACGGTMIKKVFANRSAFEEAVNKASKNKGEPVPWPSGDKLHAARS